MALATVTIDLEARLATLERDLSRAVQLNERSARQVEQQWSGIRDIASGAAQGLLAAFAGAGVAQWVKGLINGVDALNDVADATGSTVERISALEDAALRTGTPLETVEAAMLKLNAVLKDAKPGSEAERALAAIGLQAKDLKQLDPADALLRAAQALDQYADGGDKARVVQELFGKSVKEVAPLLKDLAAAGELNAKVTGDQAAEAERFNKLLADMQTNVTQVARGLLGDMLPAVNDILERLKLGREVFGGFFAAQAGRELWAPDANAVEALGRARKELERVQAMQERLASGTGFGWERAELALAPSEETLRKRIEYYSKLLKLTDGSAGGGRGVVNPGEVKPRVGSIDPKAAPAKEAARSWTDYADSVTQAVAKMAEGADSSRLAELDAQMARLQELAAAGLDPKLVEDVERLIQAQRTKITGEQTVLIPQQQLDNMREVLGMVAQTRQGQLDELARQYGILEQAFTQGAISADQYLAVLDDLDAKFGQLSEHQRGVAQEVSEFWKQAQANIQDTLANTIEQQLSGNFDNIDKMWGDMIKRMIAQAAAAKMGEALFGAGGKGGGMLSGAADWLSGLFSATQASGGAWSQGVQLYANGGVFGGPTAFRHAGGLGVLGEAGPEAVMPLARGSDGKLGVKAGGGHPVQVVIHQTVGEIVTPSQLAAVQQRTVQAAIAGVQQARARGARGYV